MTELETRDLTIRFGGHVAVNGVSCTFRPGELTAIVGPNGAGKTTYFNLIARLKQDAGKIILLVEHKMDVVRSLADRIIVLHNGQLVADGKPAEVIASPIVQEAYLGIAPGKSAA